MSGSAEALSLRPLVHTPITFWNGKSLQATHMGRTAEASRHAIGEAPPYAEAAEFVAELGILYRSLTANGSAMLARSRLRSLRRAANTFGFYLAGIDLRQNSEVHERTVGELFEMACTASNYAVLPEAARISLLREELKPDQRAQVRVDLRSASKGAGFPSPISPEAGPVPAHQGLRPDDRDGLEDRWKPSIQHDQEQAIPIRELDTTTHPPLQHNQLMSECHILCLKSALRLERRGEQGQEEPEQRDHRR